MNSVYKLEKLNRDSKMLIAWLWIKTNLYIFKGSEKTGLYFTNGVNIYSAFIYTICIIRFSDLDILYF